MTLFVLLRELHDATTNYLQRTDEVERIVARAALRAVLRDVEAHISKANKQCKPKT